MSLRYTSTYVTVVGSIEIVCCSVIYRMGVTGDVPAALVDSKLTWRPLISSGAWTVYCFVISPYIWAILLKMIQYILGSLWLDTFLLRLETLINLFCSSYFTYHNILWKILLASQTCGNTLLQIKWLSSYMLVFPSLTQQQTADHLI